MGTIESAHHPSFTFGKHEKLKSKKKIEELFKKGSSFYLSPWQLKYRRTEQPHNQVLITVPKKYHKLAVSRNRIKRLIREAYRLNRDEIFKGSESHYLIAIMYLSKDIPTYQEVESKLIDLLRRLPKD